eukprot:1313895-Rhodomonas_salina.5
MSERTGAEARALIPSLPGYPGMGLQTPLSGSTVQKVRVCIPMQEFLPAYPGLHTWVPGYPVLTPGMPLQPRAPTRTTTRSGGLDVAFPPGWVQKVAKLPEFTAEGCSSLMDTVVFVICVNVPKRVQVKTCCGLSKRGSRVRNCWCYVSRPPVPGYAIT